MRTLMSVLACALTALGVGLAAAPPAGAGCQGFWTPWGGGQRCDGPIDTGGFFQRCDTAGALGFATAPMCYQVDANNLGNNAPWIAP